MFLSYMAGQYNDKAKEKFEATKGKCIQYVELAKGNHYAITDWNPNTAPYQVRISVKHEKTVADESIMKVYAVCVLRYMRVLLD